MSRPAHDALTLTIATSRTVNGVGATANRPYLEGLPAYLADCVDPGGSQAATGTITAAGPLVGDTITFRGPDGVSTVVFTAIEDYCTGYITAMAPIVAGAAQLVLGAVNFACIRNKATGTVQCIGAQVNDYVDIAGIRFTAKGAESLAAREFDQSGTDIQAATSLAACIMFAANAALITAALDAASQVPVPGASLSGISGGTDTVTLMPSVYGAWGKATVVSSAPARIILAGGIGGGTMGLTTPVAASQEFGSSDFYVGKTDPVASVVADIVAAINAAATSAAMDIANAGPVPTAPFGHLHAVAASPRVNLTSSQLGNSGKLTLVSNQAGLVVSGATMTRTAALASALQFDSLLNADGGTNTGVATSIAAVLNNANTDTALTAMGGSSVTSTPLVAVNTVVADTAGSTGAMRVTSSNGVRLAISANALGKTMVTWTAVQLNACSTALQARVDAGSGMTATNMNTAMNAVGGVSGIAVTATNLEDILSILAGRVYRLPIPALKDPTGKNWDVTPQGSFVAPNVVHDTQMLSGEWRPLAVGGDTVYADIGGIRTTVDTAHFQASLLTGQLAHYAAGIELFPDADVQAFVSDWTRRTHRQATLTNQRVVTVYDDDGTLLA